MKALLLSFLLLTGFCAIGQRIDSVTIPRGVVYKYTDPAVVEKAKMLVRKELSDSVTYSLENREIILRNNSYD